MQKGQYSSFMDIECTQNQFGNKKITPTFEEMDIKYSQYSCLKAKTQ